MYLDATNPIVSFWSGTNYQIVSFPLALGTNEGQMVYSNASLVLLAGQPYSITLQDNQLSSGKVFSYFASGTGDFQVNTQLTAYSSAKVQTSGTFVSSPTNFLFWGPNFSFQIYTGAIVIPSLKIILSNFNTAVLTWPAPSTGFVLQRSQLLTPGNWTVVTNVPSVVTGTNRVTLSPVTNNAFFRLAHP
jgi:hypothetical protein